ncbi:hypothetical protein D3C86_1407690 [compost metagenome]
MLQIKFGFGPAVEQALGDLVAAFLQFGVTAGDGQARLGGAQGVVVLRQLRVQQHQGIFIVGLGGKPGCVRRLDGTAETPPEIQLPADIEADAVLPEMRVLGVGAARLSTVQVQAVGAGLLQLRVASTQGDTQLCPGLHDPQASDVQVGVVGIGFGHQMVQHRVVEHAPPLAAVRLRVLLAGDLQGRAVPVVDPGLGRRLEIRAQLHAAPQDDGATEQKPADASRAWHQAQTPQTGR